MAQPNLAARNLSLMEELEKLEQSITLTLQGTRRNHGIGIGTWVHALADPFHTQKSITTLARRTELLRRASSPSSTSTGSTRALCGKHQRYRLLFFVPLLLRETCTKHTTNHTSTGTSSGNNSSRLRPMSPYPATKSSPTTMKAASWRRAQRCGTRRLPSTHGTSRT